MAHPPRLVLRCAAPAIRLSLDCWSIYQRSGLGFPALPLFLILITGIILGFMGNWWRQGWIWATLIAFLAVWIWMNVRGTRTLYGLRGAIGPDNLQGIRPVRGTGIVATAAELDARIRAVPPRELTASAAILLALLLALMIFKPW